MRPKCRRAHPAYGFPGNPPSARIATCPALADHGGGEGGIIGFITFGRVPIWNSGLLSPLIGVAAYGGSHGQRSHQGSAEQAKGKVKEVAGKVLGDSKLQSEGKGDQVKGKVQNAIGGFKDALKGK